MGIKEVLTGETYLWKDGLFAREVLCINLDSTVVYRDFNFNTGWPMTTYSTCSLVTFKRGATRVLTQEESNRMQRDKAEQEQADLNKTLTALALHDASIDHLILELAKRGISLEK